MSATALSAVAVWAGIVVGDLQTAERWYAGVLPHEGVQRGEGWVAFELPDGATVELHAGDRRHPGTVFPSYGSAEGPPVMPGFAVADPDEAAADLPVMRTLPGWVVVAADDGLRVVLTDREGDAAACGLLGFTFASPEPATLTAFLARLGVEAEVRQRPLLGVVPLIAADRDADLTDPDGTPIRLVAVDGAAARSS